PRGGRADGRADGRPRPAGRRLDRFHPPPDFVRGDPRTSATTSAITTTATSAGHHDVSIPQEGTGARATPPPRSAIHPNR
ncbi:hypothetical protein, partial [Streptomyces sp. NRRL B-24572]|uniref:hypothetical protein n=1 Tax=Streptomyces sp. NRRL B-24572 TaxID=1962156 RepID=UPI001C4F8638